MEGDGAVFAICCRWARTTCATLFTGLLLPLKAPWLNARKRPFERNTVSSFAPHSTVFFRLFSLKGSDECGALMRCLLRLNGSPAKKKDGNLTAAHPSLGRSEAAPSASRPLNWSERIFVHQYSAIVFQRLSKLKSSNGDG